MCNASIAIQVLPQVDREKVIPIVDEVINYINQFDVKTFVGPFETTIEGDFDLLMDIIKQCQKICITAGAPGVMSYVKINYSPDGIWSIDEKVGKYH